MRNAKTVQTHQQARTFDVRALLLYVSLIVLTACLLLSIPYASAEELSHQQAAQKTEPDDTQSSLISLGEADLGLSPEELGASRARAMLEIDKVFINDQELNGSVSGNSAVNTYSGDNIISGDAFGNASGLVNTIQNTGNNVLIQSATIVNVSIED